jgi:putative glutamine amidotransferase
MKPTIGIVANYSYNGDSEFAEGIGAAEQEWQLLADDYISSIIKAGGIPIIIPLIKNENREEILKDIINKVDGIIFSGGNDVNPLLFGETSMGKTGGLIPERDAQELFLFKYVYEHTKKPILGICRGIQLLNVYFGGTLIQDILNEGCGSHTLSMYPREKISHWVNVKEGSLLNNIVQKTKIGVNSFHHMAVKICAPELHIIAQAEDGIIEGVELKNNSTNRFVLGVQWHPEMMLASLDQQKILRAFVNSAGK